MQMISDVRPAVNTPAIDTTIDILLVVQDALQKARLYPVYRQDGFDCLNADTQVQFRVELKPQAPARFSPEFLADETPELDDVQAPADEEAMYQAWGRTGTMAEITDAELDAMYASLCPTADDALEALYREPWSQYLARKAQSN